MDSPARSALAAALLLLLAACSGPRGAEDAGVEPDPIEDSGTAEQDAGSDPDAGSETDGGVDGGPTQKPNTYILQKPPLFSPSASATFTFIGNPATKTFECSLEGAPFSSCTSPYTASSLAEGAHTFSVRGLDANQLPDETPPSHAWTVDLTVPETTLTSAPSGDVTEPRAAIAASCSEPSCRFECALNDGGYSPCAASTVLEGLSSGAYALSLRAVDPAGNADPTPATAAWNVLPGTETVRVVAANLTSGDGQSYAPEGIRIFQGLAPDVVLIQEFKYGSNGAADLRAFVDTAFGAQFSYYRESGVSLPNGIISRYPILASGSWQDALVPDRNFAFARLDLPGPKDLWAVSIHLRTSTSGDRNAEASALVSYIQANVPAGDLLVVGGDLNTSSRTESAITTLSSVVVTSSGSAPYPVDQQGNSNTNRNRSSPYDWVLADADLNPLRAAVVVGSASFPSGLVFDSRVFTPLSAVSPVQSGDSDATNMQHMAVIKDFAIAY